MVVMVSFRPTGHEQHQHVPHHGLLYLGGCNGARINSLFLDKTPTKAKCGDEKFRGLYLIVLAGNNVAVEHLGELLVACHFVQGRTDDVSDCARWKASGLCQFF